ncbi:hypothetical protein [Maritalea sp.]|uniref:hypothetical protein n=1 Tax=Maritalea sp. TaxID=2003361 RepID=UPI003EF6CB30
MASADSTISNEITFFGFKTPVGTYFLQQNAARLSIMADAVRASPFGDMLFL